MHLSKIGMNYWGGSSLYESGDVQALLHIRRALNNKDDITVFDVGANQGEYALLVNRIFEGKAKISCFEPSRHTFETLLKNTAIVPVITCFPVGFGDKPARMKLYSSGKTSALASVFHLTDTSRPFKEEFTEEIEIDTLEQFCNTQRITKIDFLKIDIEGHEWYALKGAEQLLREKRIRFIQFEFGDCHLISRTYFRDFFLIYWAVIFISAG